MRRSVGSCVLMLAVAVALLLPVTTAAARDAAPHAASEPRGYTTIVHPEGQAALRLYAEEMGHGPTILLLHGLGGSSYSWRKVAPILARRFRVIGLDLRGFGRSDKPFDRAYSPHDHAAVVRAFIRERRLADITVVGHSYGGILALLLAMDRRLEPYRIRRIATLDTPAFPQPSPPGIDLLRRPLLPYVALHLVPPELIAGLAFAMERIGLDHMTDRDVAIYADPLRSPGGPHALIETARQIDPPDLAFVVSRYAKIAKPALVMSCRNDDVVPVSSAVRLSRTLPNARLMLIDKCNHTPAEQRPEAVAGAIEQLMAR